MVLKMILDFRSLVLEFGTRSMVLEMVLETVLDFRSLVLENVSHYRSIYLNALKNNCDFFIAS